MDCRIVAVAAQADGRYTLTRANGKMMANYTNKHGFSLAEIKDIYSGSCNPILTAETVPVDWHDMQVVEMCGEYDVRVITYDSNYGLYHIPPNQEGCVWGQPEKKTFSSPRWPSFVGSLHRDLNGRPKR